MNRLYDFLILKYTKHLQIFKVTGYALMEEKQIGKKSVVKRTKHIN